MKIVKQGLSNYSIFIVGTGATGSNLIPFVAQLLNNFTETHNHELFLLDGDLFEEKNLKNQKCTLYDINRNKAEVLAERYNAVYPNLNVSYIDNYIMNAENLIEIIERNGDTIPILIGCVDNSASRRIFNQVFNSYRIPDLIYIDSGNGTDIRTGQVVVGYKASVKKQCSDYAGSFNGYATESVSFEMLEPVCKLFPSIMKDKDKIEDLISCGEIVNEHPQNIATNVMAASTIFTIVNEIITFDTINTHIAYFDAENTHIDVKKPKLKNPSFSDCRILEINPDLIVFK